MAERDFIDSVENAIEGLVGFARRLARTFGTIARHPLRAPGLFEADADAQPRRFVPPLTFAIVSYVLFTTVTAIVSEVSEHELEPDALSKSADAAVTAINSVQTSPGKMIAFSLPVLGILLASAYLGRLISGVASRRVVAVVAYSTAFAWVGCVAAVSLAMAAVVIMDRVYPGDGDPPMLAFFGSVLLVFGATVVALVLFISGAVRDQAAERENNWARLGIGYVACLVVAHVATAWLLVRGLMLNIAVDDPARVGLVLYGAAFTDRVAGQPKIVPGNAASAEWQMIERPDQPCARLELLAAVTNRRNEPVFLPRSLGAGGELPWRAFVGASRTVPPDTISGPYLPPVTLRAWSDGANPVMMIKPAETKWLQVETCVPATTPDILYGQYAQLTGSLGNGEHFRSAWIRLDAPMVFEGSRP